jgi:hypothetical protein
VSGSYVYVVGHLSDSLVVIDISNPASPVIRGSVVSSSLLDSVRVTLSCGARIGVGGSSGDGTSVKSGGTGECAEAVTATIPCKSPRAIDRRSQARSAGR